MTEADEPPLSTERMAAIFTLRSRVQAMLRFEAALARAQARAGIMPADAAEAIVGACSEERFDVEALVDDARVSGNLAIPLVRSLTELTPEFARGYVHWGATSQDAVDTGLVLQMKEGLEALIEDVLGVGAACESLAQEHAGTPMVGRTLLQHALPITFGLKAARWLHSATRHLRRLHEVRGGLPLQFGGAVGTLAALGEDAERVAELLGEELGLPVPDLPWHTDREPLAEVAVSVGIVAGTMAKIAGDLLLLSQTEVGEAVEAVEEGRGASSTMPHKRNPVRAPAAIAAARLALGAVPVILASMVQEHERAAGSWQAELVAVPDLFRYTAGAVSDVRELLEHLEVRPERMRTNLGLEGGKIMAEGLMMALAPHVGRDEAYRIAAEVVRAAAREGTEVAHAASKDERVRTVLDPEAIEAAVDPAAYLGSSERFVRRAIDRFRDVATSVTGS